VVVEKHALLFPKLNLTAMSQQAENFGNYPASERVSSVEGVEGNVSGRIAWLSIRSEYHSKSSAEPSRIWCVFETHVEVEEDCLPMVKRFHNIGDHSLLL
jgi:hypothetical protein